jgi:hypothetical protein
MLLCPISSSASGLLYSVSYLFSTVNLIVGLSDAVLPRYAYPHSM